MDVAVGIADRRGLTTSETEKMLKLKDDEDHNHKGCLAQEDRSSRGNTP